MSPSMTDQPFGAGCAAVPTSGKGSFDGMSSDPVATAASNNPLLSTLVTAVKKAGLVDTLNNAENITVFAPTNDAFAKIDKKTLNKVLADKKTLTAILTEHVVRGRAHPRHAGGRPRQPEQAKQGVTVKGSGEDFTVNGAPRSSAATCRPPTPRCTSSTPCCCRSPEHRTQATRENVRQLMDWNVRPGPSRGPSSRPGGPAREAEAAHLVDLMARSARGQRTPSPSSTT